MIGRPDIMIRTSAPAPKYARKTPSRPPIRGKQQRFGQYLAHQAKPAGAQRDAHGHLVPPGRPARQQHACQVGAGDQQQQAHHGHQRQKRFRELIAQAGGKARAAGSTVNSTGACKGSWLARVLSSKVNRNSTAISARACAIETPGPNRPINCKRHRCVACQTAPRCPAAPPPATPENRAEPRPQPSPAYRRPRFACPQWPDPD